MEEQQRGVFEVQSGEYLTKCWIMVHPTYRGIRTSVGTSTDVPHPTSKKMWRVRASYIFDVSSVDGIVLDPATHTGFSAGLVGGDARPRTFSGPLYPPKGHDWLGPVAAAIRDHGNPAIQHYLRENLPILRTMISDRIDKQRVGYFTHARDQRAAAEFNDNLAEQLGVINTILLAGDASIEKMAVALDRYDDVYNAPQE